MDADLKAELDALADETERDYQVLRDSAKDFPRVLTDGVCRITEVIDNAQPPCVGYVWTNLGEKFPVFDVFTREQAKTLTGKRVFLKMAMSRRGTRYVVGMQTMPVDASTPVWPCAKCGGAAVRIAWWVIVGDVVARDTYFCHDCLYQMEVGP